LANERAETVEGLAQINGGQAAAQASVGGVRKLVNSGPSSPTRAWRSFSSENMNWKGTSPLSYVTSRNSTMMWAVYLQVE
jgi:hypothetical protein